MTPLRIVILASGRGSNFRAIVDAVDHGELRGCHIVSLIVDRPGTGAEEIALTENLPFHKIVFQEFKARDEYDAALQSYVEELAPDLILTLGYMRILARDFIRKFRWKIINIHPSLLPAFPGIRSQRKALEYGVKITGATTHFVDEGTDTGPIIMQSPVIVPEDTDEEELAALILIEEHKIIVESVRLFGEGHLQIDERRVRVLNL